MFKNDATRRRVGAAWVIVFLTTLLLPVGTASANAPQVLDLRYGGAARLAEVPAVGVAQLPAVDAQVGDPPTLAASAEPSSAAPAEAAAPIELPLSQPAAAPLEQPSAQELAAQATLEVRQQLLEAAALGAAFAPATTGLVVAEGYQLRTDGSGTGRLVYFEGSTTSINPNSQIVVDQLRQSPAGNPITRLIQAAGTTLSRIVQLTDPAGQFQIETPAATALLHGTDLRVEQLSPVGGARRFRFQNLTNPPGSSPVIVTGFGRTVTILGGQETTATEGQGPGPVLALGAGARQAQNQQQQVSSVAAAQQMAAQAAQAGQAARAGALQAAAIQVAQAATAAQQQALFGQQVGNPQFFPPAPQRHAPSPRP